MKQGIRLVAMTGLLLSGFLVPNLNYSYAAFVGGFVLLVIFVTELL